MSVLGKIDNFLKEDNKSKAKAGVKKFKPCSKKLSQIIGEQNEEYAESLFDKMADFINQVDLSDLTPELALMRNEIIGELYPGEEEPYDDDEFTGEESEDDDAQGNDEEDFDADFGEEITDTEYYESRKLRGTLLKGKK